jgi:hypothetical protein
VSLRHGSVCWQDSHAEGPQHPGAGASFESNRDQPLHGEFQEIVKEFLKQGGIHRSMPIGRQNLQVEQLAGICQPAAGYAGRKAGKKPFSFSRRIGAQRTTEQIAAAEVWDPPNSCPSRSRGI